MKTINEVIDFIDKICGFYEDLNLTKSISFERAYIDLRSVRGFATGEKPDFMTHEEFKAINEKTNCPS